MNYKESYVKIINPTQMKIYVKNGVKPIDIYYNKYEDKIIYVFTKRETKRLYDLWNKRLLK